MVTPRLRIVFKQYLTKNDTQKMTVKAFIFTGVGYCPLVWMFHGRKLKINFTKCH